MQEITTFRSRLPGAAEKTSITFFYNPEDGMYWRKNGNEEAYPDLKAADIALIDSIASFRFPWSKELVKHAKSLGEDNG